MAKDKYLKNFLLETKLLNKTNLKEMINKHGFVVFKPNIGGGGRHVGFVFKTLNYYRVKLNTKTYYFKSLKRLYKFILNLNIKKEFIIQKGVRLKKINNRPFDIRIEVQLVDTKFKVTGIVAKVAPKNKLVTNRHSGGMGTPIKKVLKLAGAKKHQTSKIISKLNTLGYKTAVNLAKKYPNIKELGLDVGLDEHMNIYVLEVNTKPQFGVFKQLKNQKLYNRINKINTQILNNITKFERTL